eukprot:scaffold200699_cov36-Cyclotella_meneghiniana.AAC.1
MSSMTMTTNLDPLKYGDESAESLPNKRKYKSEENQQDSSENSPFVATTTANSEERYTAADSNSEENIHESKCILSRYSDNHPTSKAVAPPCDKRANKRANVTTTANSVESNNAADSDSDDDSFFEIFDESKCILSRYSDNHPTSKAVAPPCDKRVNVSTSNAADNATSNTSKHDNVGRNDRANVSADTIVSPLSNATNRAAIDGGEGCSVKKTGRSVTSSVTRADKAEEYEPDGEDLSDEEYKAEEEGQTLTVGSAAAGDDGTQPDKRRKLDTAFTGEEDSPEHIQRLKRIYEKA